MIVLEVLAVWVLVSVLTVLAFDAVKHAVIAGGCR